MWRVPTSLRSLRRVPLSTSAASMWKPTWDALGQPLEFSGEKDWEAFEDQGKPQVPGPKPDRYVSTPAVSTPAAKMWKPDWDALGMPLDFSTEEDWEAFESQVKPQVPGPQPGDAASVGIPTGVTELAPLGAKHLPNLARNLRQIDHVKQTFLPQVRRDRLQRVRDMLKRHDYAAGIFHDPCHVRYACDASNMTLWHKRNQIRYLLVPAADADPVTIFESPFVDRDGLEPLIGETIDKWVPNLAVNFCSVGDGVADKIDAWAGHLNNELEPICKAAGNFKLAVQGGDPLQASALERRGYQLGSGSQVIEHARAIKVPNEIELIKCGIQTTCDAMMYLRSRIQPGISENVLWSKLHEYNIAVGGEYVETRLLNSGRRTSPWMQETSTKLIEGGDLVALDSDCTGPFGYFIDASRTWHCPFGHRLARSLGKKVKSTVLDYSDAQRKKLEKQRELHKYAREQLDWNMSITKPGMEFREWSEKCWPIPDRFKDRRYGVAVHGNGMNGEYPYLYHPMDVKAFGYDGVIHENMTLTFESFIAEDDEDGVKLGEHTLITKDGVENLTAELPFSEYLDK